MADAIYTVVLDVTDNGCIDTGWRLHQGDYGESQVVVKVVNNGVNMFDASILPQITFKRSDGISIVGEMFIEDSTYKYNFVGNELEVPGFVLMDVKLIDSQGRTSTAASRFIVLPNTEGDTQEGSHTYINSGLVSELRENVQTAVESAATSVEKALVSEGWANGKQNGVPVEEGSPYYHNNAEYWSQQSNPTRFGSLSDVDFGILRDDDIPVYDATSEKWVNEVGVSTEIKNASVVSGETKIRTRTGGILQSCGVKLEPVQSGSGTPSPSNVRPISGHDEIVINNDPKNWIPYIEDGDLNVTTGAEEPTASKKRSGFIAIDRTKRYVISGFNVGMYGADIKFCFYNADKTFIGGEFINISQGQDVYFPSFSSGTAYIRFAASSSVITNKMQAEIGTVSTAYEPYREPEQTTISLGQTVYGGSLDVVSGVLTVDKVGVDMGSLSWTLYQANVFTADVTGRKFGNFNILCSMYPISASSTIGGMQDEEIKGSSDNNKVIIKDTSYSSDASALTTAVTGQQLVYELATPLTIQLTPQQIETLIGQNNISIPLEGQSLDSLTYREMMAWNDLEKAIEPKADKSSIGTEEKGATASKSYTVGEHFLKDGKFCTAIASISSGATLTLNTNYVEGTIAEAVRYEEGSITPSTGITMSYNQVRRFGKVVNVWIAMGTPSNMGSDVTLGTIDFIPSTNFGFLNVTRADRPYVSVGEVFIRNNGQVILPSGIPSSTNIYIFGTYICQ